MACALIAGACLVLGALAGHVAARRRCAGRHHAHDRITLRRPRRR